MRPQQTARCSFETAARSVDETEYFQRCVQVRADSASAELIPPLPTSRVLDRATRPAGWLTSRAAGYSSEWRVSREQERERYHRSKGYSRVLNRESHAAQSRRRYARLPDRSAEERVNEYSSEGRCEGDRKRAHRSTSHVLIYRATRPTCTADVGRSNHNRCERERERAHRSLAACSYTEPLHLRPTRTADGTQRGVSVFG